MKRYALDASFVIEFLAGKDSAKKFYQKNNDQRFIVPAPAKLEVERGTENLGGFEQLETDAFGEKEVKEALRMLDYLEKNGRMIGILDLMIASIASVGKMTLVTYDKDFENLKEYDNLDFKVIEQNG